MKPIGVILIKNMLKEKKILKIFFLLTIFFLILAVNKKSLAAERIFYEDCEDTNFSEYFLERHYGTHYASYWQEVTSELTRSDFEPHSGHYSMTYDPFTAINPHAAVGIGPVPYGNTSNFRLSDYSGRYWYFRWYQRWEKDIDWGGYLVKMLYINYQDTPDFTYAIINTHSTGGLSTLKDYDTYSLQSNVWYSTPEKDDMRWHKMELLLDVGETGKNNGSILFKVDDTVAVNETNLHFNNTISSNPIDHITGWPSNRSGVGGSGTGRTWLDDLEIYILDGPNDIPPELTENYQCNDGLDNDNDSLIDYPSDPDCASTTDNSESGSLDTSAPIISSLQPNGELAAGTTEVIMSLVTDETATCKYDIVANTGYSAMTHIFNTTNGTSHSHLLNNLTNGGNYIYYIKCVDDQGNANTTDTIISFTVNSVSNMQRSDVDQSGSVNVIDALLILRKSFNLNMAQTGWQDNNITGDVNCDGNVTLTDALLLMRYALGINMTGTDWCG